MPVKRGGQTPLHAFRARSAAASLRLFALLVAHHSGIARDEEEVRRGSGWRCCSGGRRGDRGGRQWRRLRNARVRVAQQLDFLFSSVQLLRQAEGGHLVQLAGLEGRQRCDAAGCAPERVGTRGGARARGGHCEGTGGGRADGGRHGRQQNAKIHDQTGSALISAGRQRQMLRMRDTKVRWQHKMLFATTTPAAPLSARCPLSLTCPPPVSAVAW